MAMSAKGENIMIGIGIKAVRDLNDVRNAVLTASLRVVTAPSIEAFKVAKVVSGSCGSDPARSFSLSFAMFGGK